jgi:hypothetical protein
MAASGGLSRHKVVLIRGYLWRQIRDEKIR